MREGQKDAIFLVNALYCLFVFRAIVGSGSVSNGGPRDLDIHMQAVPGRWGDTGRDGVK